MQILVLESIYTIVYSGIPLSETIGNKRKCLNKQLLDISYISDLCIIIFAAASSFQFWIHTGGYFTTKSRF